MLIDLNADLGEGCAHDQEILDSVSSINVACAWHAGSAEEMLTLVRAARLRGVAIGAHPGFPDRAGFGRKEMNLPLSSVRAGLLYQIGALDGIVRAEGGTVAHVKAHGALYNQAARDPELAHCIARAIRDFDPRLKVMGLAGSVFIEAVRAEGLIALEEGFADRGYTSDGRLVTRGTAGALIDNQSAMLAQVLSMVKTGTVIAQDGALCQLHVDTICLHGDGPHALEFAKAIRARLRQEGIEVAACAG
ncbi:MAG TPA: 5-oxoprolinase subunit PxpA [Steroidobacteraceae bacterium]|nr:5-oxoprolinase subunit PxpA [Steroidobacteraceae bacterium]